MTRNIFKRKNNVCLVNNDSHKVWTALGLQLKRKLVPCFLLYKEHETYDYRKFIEV